MSNLLNYLHDGSSTTVVAHHRCCCRCGASVARALPALRCYRAPTVLLISLCLSQRLAQRVSNTLDYLHDGGFTTVCSPPILPLLLRACYAHTTCSVLPSCTDCTPEQLLYSS
jgi:hypothetical protein